MNRLVGFLEQNHLNDLQGNTCQRYQQSIELMGQKKLCALCRWKWLWSWIHTGSWDRPTNKQDNNHCISLNLEHTLYIDWHKAKAKFRSPFWICIHPNIFQGEVLEIIDEFTEIVYARLKSPNLLSS